MSKKRDIYSFGDKQSTGQRTVCSLETKYESRRSSCRLCLQPMNLQAVSFARARAREAIVEVSAGQDAVVQTRGIVV